MVQQSANSPVDAYAAMRISTLTVEAVEIALTKDPVSAGHPPTSPR